MSRNRWSSRWWLLVGAAVAVGVWWWIGRGDAPVATASQSAYPSSAYQPKWRERRAKELRSGGAAEATRPGPGDERGEGSDGDDELTPELKMRLEAASNIVTVPAPGYVPPPTAELTPAISADIDRALPTWASEAQRSLDRCVGRPEAARKEVHLSVMFTPSVTAPPAPGAAPPIPTSLSPAYVAVHPDDLRRLWKDTDPDALQSCIDQLRIQELPVVSTHIAAGLAPPSTHQNVTVKL